MNHTTTRRIFLGQAAAGIATAAVATSATGYAKNDTIHVGCIGTGGRCRHLMGELRQIPGVKIVAVCDVGDDNLARGAELADPKAYRCKEHEKLLSRRDIDAVLIATSDHWHVPVAIDACHAGKDVYVEKPLTHSVEEGAGIIRAQLESKRVVQVGMQQRSMPHLQEAKALIESGAIGKPIKIHCTWNRNMERSPKPANSMDPATVDWERFCGNAPQQPWDEFRYRNWRFFWEFGGGIFTDLMVHWIDTAHWMLNITEPVTAQSIGSWYNKEGIWQTPDTVQTLMMYANPEIQAYFEGTFSNQRNKAMLEIMGTEGTIYCDRGRYEYYPEPRNEKPYKELVLGSGEKGSDFFDNPNGERIHLQNWLDCIRTRNDPNSPVTAGVHSGAAAHLANTALRQGSVATWGA